MDADYDSYLKKVNCIIEKCTKDNNENVTEDIDTLNEIRNGNHWESRRCYLLCGYV